MQGGVGRQRCGSGRRARQSGGGEVKASGVDEEREEDGQWKEVAVTLNVASQL